MTDFRAGTDSLMAAFTADERKRLNRREVLRLGGALGLATAGVAVVGGVAGATGSRPARGMMSRFQQATPAAPAATPPAVGVRPDGTRLWRVLVGSMDMDNGLELQAFMPEEITINAGDAIFFDAGQMPGFHTVTFVGGGQPPALIMPDPAATPQAGPPKLIFNPAALFPGGNPAAYDGTGLLNSGAIPLLPPGTFFVVTFTKAGTYDYLCLPHQGVMKAKVIVQDKGASLPHEQADYDKMAADQQAKLVEQGKAEIAKYANATQTQQADGTTLWEATVGAGESQARVQRMLPGDLPIKAGDTVRWVHRAPGEPHTVTFVNGEAPPQDPIVEPQPAGPPKLILNPQTFLPQGGKVNSGKGYFNSGYLGKEFSGAETYELRFDTPGTYTYYCVLHGDAKGTGMAGKVTVTAR